MNKIALLSAGVVLQGCVTYLSFAAEPAVPAAPPSPAAVEFFEKNVRPVLAEKCYSCHGPKNQFASLRLDSKAALLKGSDKGAVVVPGDPEKSRLIQAVRHAGGLKMPPAEKLPDQAIGHLVEWIKMGAPWPTEAVPSGEKTFEQRMSEARTAHWAFRPVKRPTLPAVKDKLWASNPVDRFILAKLEAKGLKPAPPADRTTLLRRVTYDLTGLPPTTADVVAFVNDKSPNAYAKVVDRLLASPQYGERWGRVWLDVARYADTLGYLVGDAERRYPFAYTYRDYVVRAFNEDKPFDRFLHEQLAADQLQLQNPADLAALGFLTIGNRYLFNRHEIIDDRIDVVTRGLQGMTVGCARCHDHKFDPIPTADYYALYSIFANSQEPGDLPVIGEPADKAAYTKYQEELSGLEKKLADLKAQKADEKQTKPVEEQLAKLKQFHPGAPPRAMALNDAPNPGKQRIFLRGNPGTQGAEVPRRFLTVLASSGQPAAFQKGSGRLELAQALTSPENPLTARVMVNRVWAQHFGKGLVGTPSDFGIRGDAPTHPELLDYLAATFSSPASGAKPATVAGTWRGESGGGRDGTPLTTATSGAWGSVPTLTPTLTSSTKKTSSTRTAPSTRGSATPTLPNTHTPTQGMGWSIKSLHRLLVLSNTYQMASTETAQGAKLDVDNRLLHRMNRRRLDFEQLRDTMLMAAGELDLTVGGKAVDMFDEKTGNRRTLYGFIDRQNLPSLFRTFDFADPNYHSPQRYNTTVPQQALFLLNNGFVHKTARGLMARSGIAVQKTPEDRIRQMYRVLFGRSPAPDELALGVAFVKKQDSASDQAVVETPAWQYGYGEFDPAGKRMKSFTPLPHFTGRAWQGGPNLPDPKTGWVTLGGDFGHAGNDLQHATVRRWVAPHDLTLSITGTVRHGSNQGDGVRALVVSSRTGLLGSWDVHNGSVEAKVAEVTVKKGDTIDFVIECRANPNFDSFNWGPGLSVKNPAPSLAQAAWDAAADFSGPVQAEAAKPLSAWEAYAQALIMTNEFHFID